MQQTLHIVLGAPLAAALCAFSIALAPIQGPPATVEREGYVGAVTCRACHSDQYASWYGSRHRRSVDAEGWVGAGEWRVALEASEAGWLVTARAQQRIAGAEPRAVDLNAEPQLLDRHWSRPGVSFATHCADCHVGDWSAAEKNAQSLDISCESCHGPGGEHKTWGMAKMMGREVDDPTGTKGWKRQVFGADYASWSADPKTGSPLPRDVPNARTQVETCARCHAPHDAILTDRLMAEAHALDAVSPRFALEVEPGEQGLAEIAAFDTSRMHAAGVACSDCHNTHSGALYSTDDALCLRCHEGGHYDAAKHSRHTGEDAPTCIDCHMPRGVTGARSHHLLPPGDPLAEWLRQPDACASCHADWTDEERAEAWSARRAMPRTPRARDALTADDVEAWGKLALDASIAPSLRGIAAQRFGTQAEPKSIAPLLASDEALVRLGALRGLRGRDIASIASALSPLATDDLRAVRVELGRLVGTLEEARRASLFGEAAVGEATAAR